MTMHDTNNTSEEAQEAVTPLENKVLTSEQERYINGWSWGAFFGGIWWFVASGITNIKGTKWLWIILYLIPYVTFIPWIRFALQGRRLSWEQRDYKDFAELKRRERFFATLFLSLYVIITGLYILLSLSAS